MIWFSLYNIQPVYLKGNKSWVFIGRTDAKTEAPILWPPNSKYWLTRKDSDAGKDWRWEEMVGWHHQLDGHEFEQALGVDDGQGSLVCCSPWSCKELDMTEWLNWTEHNILVTFIRLPFSFQMLQDTCTDYCRTGREIKKKIFRLQRQSITGLWPCF